MSQPQPGRRGPVVVDTGVFAAELLRRGAPLAASYRSLLEGRPFIVSVATVAEVRFGAELADWGCRDCNASNSDSPRPVPGRLLDLVVIDSASRSLCNPAEHVRST